MQMREAKPKPKIEDVAKTFLGGGALQNALDFVAFLRANKLNPAWSAANAWKVSYKGFTVCFIRMHGAAEYHGLVPGEWNLAPFIGEYEADALPDEDKETAWANKRTCSGCGQCALQLDTVFGKKYDYACEAAICFRNPDVKAIACAKKIITLRRDEIKAGAAKKHKYVPMKDKKQTK
jgi:NAD-dependent dihydropyrimidine dehydrogenase PreA subunit